MPPRRFTLLALVLAAAPIATVAQTATPTLPFGALRDQATLRQGWLERRLTDVLPRLMRAHGVGMWIVPSREYNEDPVFFALVGPTTFAARRRTILVFCDRGPDHGFERYSIGGSDHGGLYTLVRDSTAPVGVAGARRRPAEPFGPEQWRLLVPLVERCDPPTIAVNISPTHAFADGLTVGEWEQLWAALPERYRARVVRRERLPIEYLEERLPEMLPSYRQMQAWVHDLLRTAFSRAVITPGVTRTDDVVWWLRERVRAAGLEVWFQPSVTVQRAGVEMSDSANPVIRPGDLLHVDFGIRALGLCTDTQHMGYVLRPGEADAPAGLVAALARAHRLQDLVLEELEPGRTGNEVLRRVRARMAAEGIDGSVYSHPIGDHGHGAGPLIGLWDRQDGVPGRGELPVRPNTWFSIELQATSAVPEWGGQRVRIALEEEAYLDAAGRRAWVLGRQERFYLVR